jgi:hypothetical protein
MLVRHAGLCALGIVASVAIGAGGARLFWPHDRLVDGDEQAGGSVQLVDPAVETPAEAAVTEPLADVEIDDVDTPLPEPPPDRAEAPGPAPNDHSEWLKGNWSWNDQEENYSWVSGCWYDQYAFAPFAPPRARHERVRRAPSSAFVYRPGYWRFGGQKYSWVSGHYTRKHAGYVYVAPRYVKVHGHWEWRTGAWVAEQEIALARQRLARLAEARRHSAHPTREVAAAHAEPARAPSWSTGLLTRKDATSVRSSTASTERADVEQGGTREEANRQEIDAARVRDEARQKAREEIAAKNETAREARNQARQERDQRRAEAVERRHEREVRAEQTRELDRQAHQAHEAEVRDEAIREHARQIETNHEHGSGFVHPGTEHHFGETEIAKPKVEQHQVTPPPQTHVGARGAKSG